MKTVYRYDPNAGDDNYFFKDDELYKDWDRVSWSCSPFVRYKFDKEGIDFYFYDGLFHTENYNDDGFTEVFSYSAKEFAKTLFDADRRMLQWLKEQQ